jgi:hypothetical protein
MPSSSPSLPPQLAKPLTEAKDLAVQLMEYPPFKGKKGQKEDLSNPQATALFRWAKQKGLLPFVHVAFEVDTRKAIFSVDQQMELEKAYAWNAARNSLFLEELKEIAKHFERAEVPLMIFKGAAELASPIHPFPGARFMLDLDILVPPDRFGDAYQVLTQMGYGPKGGQLPNKYLDLSLVHESAAGEVELHHHPIYPAYFEDSELENLWKSAIPVKLGGARSWVPSPTNRLYIRLMHNSLDELQILNRRFEHLYEMACLIENHGHAMDWGQIQDLMHHHRMERFFSVLFLLVQDLFLLNFPDRCALLFRENSVRDLALIHAANSSKIPKWGHLGLRRLIATQLQSRGFADWFLISPRMIFSGGRELWDKRLRQVFNHHHIPSHLPPVFSLSAVSRLFHFAMRIIVHTIMGTFIAMPFWCYCNLAATRMWWGEAINKKVAKRKTARNAKK